MAQKTAMNTGVRRRVQRAWKSRDFRAALRNSAGAIDLASIMVGVLVIGVIAGIIAATVFAVIPWSQDAAAKQSLSAVRDAESVAYVRGSEGSVSKYQDKAGLLTDDLLQDSPKIGVAIDSGGTCYVGVSKSATGKIFFVTDKGPDVTELTAATDPGCIDPTVLTPLISTIGGFPSIAGPGGTSGVPVAGVGPDMSICADPTAAWVIQDPIVEASIRDNLGKTSSDPLLVSDASDVTYIYPFNFDTTSGPASLEGVQCARNATDFDLFNSTVTDFTPVQGLPKITAIYIQNNTAMTDLHGLSNFPALTKLYIEKNAAMTSLAGLADLPALKAFYVQRNPALINLTGYSGLTGVTAMYVQGNASLTGLAGLKDMPALESVGVSNNPKLTSITGMSNLPAITAFALNSNVSLPSINGASILTNVQNFEVNGSPLIADVTDLTSLPNLDTLALADTSMTDLSTLPALPALTTLKLQRNTQMRAFTGLAGRSTLLALYSTSNTALISVSAIVSLSGLEAVSISDSPNLTTLNGLGLLPALTSASFTGTLIGSLTELYDKSALYELTLYDSPNITDADVDAVKAALPGLVYVNR